MTSRCPPHRLALSRRAVLAGSAALVAARPCAAGSAAGSVTRSATGPVDKPRSFAATHGSAPFDSRHLIPGASLDLARINPAAAGARVVALTIDDGPDANDRRILDLLKRHEARATFFCIGRKITGAAVPIATAIAESGNEVGSHSHTHPMMSDLSATEQERNLSRANAALAAVGVRPRWFRPPFGDFDDTTTALATALGMQTVLWTIDSQDWKNTPAATIAARVTDRLAPGAVVLMHSTKAETVKALPTILEAGHRKGFRFVTLTDWWAAMAAAQPA